MTSVIIKLSRIDSEIKYLVIAITSHNCLTFDKVNGAFCSIVDSETKKEVMYLRISKKEEHSGLLFGILGRVDGRVCCTSMEDILKKPWIF